MRKYLLLCTALTLYTPSVYALECKALPRCQDLGFTQSEKYCEGKYFLRCPFDSKRGYCGGEISVASACDYISMLPDAGICTDDDYIHVPDGNGSFISCWQAECEDASGDTETITCPTGQVLVGTTCHTYYANCAAAGMVSAAGSCTEEDYTHLYRENGATMSCWNASCESTGTDTGNDETICGSTSSGTVIYCMLDEYNQQNDIVVAGMRDNNNIVNNLTMANISKQECLDRYIKPLEVDNDDDFVVYGV